MEYTGRTESRLEQDEQIGIDRVNRISEKGEKRTKNDDKQKLNRFE